MPFTHVFLFTHLGRGCLGFYLRIKTQIGQGVSWRRLAGGSPKGHTALSGTLADFRGACRSSRGRQHGKLGGRLPGTLTSQLTPRFCLIPPRTPARTAPPSRENRRLERKPSVQRTARHWTRLFPNSDLEELGDPPLTPHDERTHELVKPEEFPGKKKTGQIMDDRDSERTPPVKRQKSASERTRNGAPPRRVSRRQGKR